MADSLYRSHTLERTQDTDGITTSGSITLWEDNPNSPYDVNDIFQPVPDGPILTVKKVSINDNVLGEKNGKVLRQWQITIEGSADVQNLNGNDIQIKYDFEIDTDDDDNIFHSGTMQVVNTGDAPIFAISMGNKFNVPGIGQIKCTKIRGNDSYSDKGVHTWTVTYEGTDKKEESNNQDENRTEYNFSAEKNNSGEIIYSGSRQVINEGSTPSIIVPVGGDFSVPGVGKIKCTKFSGNDEYTADGKRRWIITYEGSTEQDSSNNNEEVRNPKYNFSIEKNSNGEIISSGSMQTSNSSGNSPALTIQVGKTFNIPGIGQVNCTKISGNDEYTSDGARRWIVTYEGSSEQDSSSSDGEVNVTYSFNIEKDSNEIIRYSGSKEFTVKGNISLINIGDTFNVPPIGILTCNRIHGQGNSITYEGVRGSSDNNNISLPLNEESMSYEINGNTIRSVSGELIALIRSSTPIMKKNIVIYDDNITNITTAGTSYSGGIVLSENISKEVIKVDNVEVKSYYRHEIEVES